MLASNGVKKIKILFAVPRFSVGGAEKFLVHHLGALDTTRYDVSLITYFDEKHGSCADDSTHIDHCFHAHSTWDVRAIRRLFRYVREGNFDVVVTHLFTANLLVRIAAILAHVDVIISYEHNIYPNKRYWQIVADKVLSWFTDRIIVESDAAKYFTSEQEWIPQNKFQTIIIPPLLDDRSRRTKETILTSLGIPVHAFLVVTVSRLVVDKGHRYLVAAIPNVLAKHPDTFFLIGGWGPLQAELEAQVEQFGVSDRVKILGRVDGQEFTSIADIYVDPSVSTDLPIGIMEAMREGKAIVATTVGEVSNFVQNEKTGLTVPPGDPHALADAINRMLDHEELRHQYGAAAKEKCAEYSLENYMETFDGLIVETLKKRA